MSSGIFNKYTGFHNRRSIRLPGYDYSGPGYYFVTICIHDRKRNLFGDVSNGGMSKNEFGLFAEQCWHEIPDHFPFVCLDEFTVMPNHIHGIIRICDGSVGANDYSPLHHANDYSPLHHANDYSPLHHANDYSPLHHANDYSPLHHANDYSPLHHANDYSPLHHANDYSPLQQTNDNSSPQPMPPQTAIHSVEIPHHPQGTSKTIGSIIRGYKIGVTKSVRRQIPDSNVWQRNYFEHIIRNEKSLYFIRKYIRENPVNWCNDMENHIDKEIQEIQTWAIKDEK